MIIQSSHPGLIKHDFSAPEIGFDYYANVFDIDFLNQVLDLQEALVSLTATKEGLPGQVDGTITEGQVDGQVSEVPGQFDGQVSEGNVSNRTVTLGDICFKPLYPTYAACTIQSPLNYFQNNRTRLNAQVVDPYFESFVYADYMDHLAACVRFLCIFHSSFAN